MPLLNRHFIIIFLHQILRFMINFFSFHRWWLGASITNYSFAAKYLVCRYGKLRRQQLRSVLFINRTFFGICIYFLRQGNFITFGESRTGPILQVEIIWLQHFVICLRSKSILSPLILLNNWLIEMNYFPISNILIFFVPLNGQKAWILQIAVIFKNRIVDVLHFWSFPS